MDSTEYLSICAVGLPIAVQGLKEFFPKIDPRVWSMGLSMLAGLAYAIMNHYVGTEAMASIMAIGGTVFGIGTALYKLQKSNTTSEK